MSDGVMNPENNGDVHVSNAVSNAGGESGGNDQGNNATPQAPAQVQGLTVEDVQALIAEAIANFKSELVMSAGESDEDNESKEENNFNNKKEEKSL